jgi:hypothetical protein
MSKLKITQIDNIEQHITTDMLNRQDKESYNDLNDQEIAEINIRSVYETLNSYNEGVIVLNKRDMSRILEYIIQVRNYIEGV